MLDIKFIQEHKEEVKQAIKYRRLKIDLDEILALSADRKKILEKDEILRAKRNDAAKLGKKGASVGKKIKAELQKIEPRLAKLNSELNDLMLLLPNPARSDVPVGRNEDDNIVLKRISGIKLKVDLDNVKNHLELGKALDIIDVDQAGIVSGSRFCYLKNEAVLLQFALINWIMELLIKEKFTPIIPPVIEKFEVAKGTGYFEALSDDAYHLKNEESILVGTSEQTVVPYLKDKIVPEKDLPMRFIGYSTCFRREAGSYGKDVQGILRQHQFDKLEMVTFVKPQDSDKEQEYLLSLEEKIMKSLKIPYRVMKMCTGDLGLPAVRKYDIEAWIPSQDKYRETHSVSNCTDFQARRLNMKYKTADGKNEYLHTLNGTASAMGRMIIAIMENYQQTDGSILVPKVLQKYTKFKVIKKNQ